MVKATENRRPHALLVVENCWVPQDRRVWNQARTIAANGYDVTVVSPKARAEGSTAGRERLEGIDIVRFAMPFGGPKKLDFLFEYFCCLLYTSPSPRDATLSRMPSSA